MYLNTHHVWDSTTPRTFCIRRSINATGHIRNFFSKHRKQHRPNQSSLIHVPVPRVVGLERQLVLASVLQKRWLSLQLQAILLCSHHLYFIIIMSIITTTTALSNSIIIHCYCNPQDQGSTWVQLKNSFVKMLWDSLIQISTLSSKMKVWYLLLTKLKKDSKYNLPRTTSNYQMTHQAPPQWFANPFF